MGLDMRQQHTLLPTKLCFEYHVWLFATMCSHIWSQQYQLCSAAVLQRKHTLRFGLQLKQSYCSASCHAGTDHV